MVEIAAIILAAGRSSRFDAGPQETKLAAPSSESLWSAMPPKRR